jgi:dynein heavy chain
LDQYQREVDIIDEIFKKNRDSPPLAKNQPKIAGSIQWCHSLFDRIKKTIVRFQSLQEMVASDQGRVVTKKYLNVAKSMKAYEEQLYHQWCINVEANSLNYLKNHVLVKDTRQVPVNGILPFHEKIVVNFRVELKDIIKETNYLDKMNLSVPEAALNVTLQEEKYFNLISSLNQMISSYDSVIEPLDDAERKLFGTHINELKRIMKPGFTRLNWNSLGIPEFIQKCNMEIQKLSSLVNQTRKNSDGIVRAIESITHAKLILEPDENDIVDAHEFFDSINIYRNRSVETLVSRYRSIGPLLMKTESLVANTNTGNSKMLSDYYQFWEKKIFKALNYVF